MNADEQAARDRLDAAEREYWSAFAAWVSTQPTVDALLGPTIDADARRAIRPTTGAPMPQSPQTGSNAAGVPTIHQREPEHRRGA